MRSRIGVPRLHSCLSGRMDIRSYIGDAKVVRLGALLDRKPLLASGYRSGWPRKFRLLLRDWVGRLLLKAQIT